MCLQDWRIGRFITTKSTYFSTPSTGDVLASASRQRVGITFFGYGLISSGAIVGVGYDGILDMFAPSYDGPIFHFNLPTHGSLPCKEFLAGSNAFGADISITEYFLPESMLTEALEHFKREYPKWPG